MKDSLGLTWHSVFVTVWIREKKCNLTLKAYATIHLAVGLQLYCEFCEKEIRSIRRGIAVGDTCFNSKRPRRTRKDEMSSETFSSNALLDISTALSLMLSSSPVMSLKRSATP